MSAHAPGLRARLAGALPREERTAAERERLAALVLLLAERPLPAGLAQEFPLFGKLQDRLSRALKDWLAGHASDGAGDVTGGERIEECFLELYAHLHGHEARYRPEERGVVDATGGYWAHAGGLTPILKAPDWLAPHSHAVDFGAANGLQGLLMQWLAPHERFVQVEISSRALETGRRLQRWLDIPDERVEWRAEDVCEAAGREERHDFIYLYRPVRPAGAGLAFYERLTRRLTASAHPVTIFSIADCLGPFLGEDFEVVYADGQLTCFHRPARR